MGGESGEPKVRKLYDQTPEAVEELKRKQVQNLTNKVRDEIPAYGRSEKTAKLELEFNKREIPDLEHELLEMPINWRSGVGADPARWVALVKTLLRKRALLDVTMGEQSNDEAMKIAATHRRDYASMGDAPPSRAAINALKQRFSRNTAGDISALLVASRESDRAETPQYYFALSELYIEKRLDESNAQEPR